MRLAVALSLVATLSSVAAADRVSPPPTFAQAPVAEAPVRRMPTVTRAQVRAALVDARTASLVRFEAYVRDKIYPNNVYSNGALNVWRDQAGHYCAAASIIKMSGEIALVEKTAEDDNNIKLADVHDGPLMDWMLMSGLTQEELALIQRPFNPVTRKPQVEPTGPVVVDAQMRTQETARLLALYRKIQTKLDASSKKSIETATTRLMKNPRLAYQLVQAS